MARSPFVLCTRKLKAGVFWYARFYHPENPRKYVVRATGVAYTDKKGHNRLAAYDAARGMIDTVLLRGGDNNFLEYVTAFWAPGSPYIKMRELGNKTPFSAIYLDYNRSGIKLHVATYKPFQKVSVSKLSIAMIEDWKLYCLKKGVGVRRLNATMQALRVPIRYLYDRQEIDRNPFDRIKPVPYHAPEKGILNREEVHKLLEVKESDPRASLAVLLAAFCGLRRGEIRGLRWEDVDLEKKLLYIRHNLVYGESLKGCKWGSERTVFFPSALLPKILEVRNFAKYKAPENYVLCEINSDNPIGLGFARSAFVRMMKAIGIDETSQKKRNLTLHGMRHTFVSLARAVGIPDIEVQALAGHKSAEMMSHYSHGSQIIDFTETRKRFEAIEQERAQ